VPSVGIIEIWDDMASTQRCTSHRPTAHGYGKRLPENPRLCDDRGPATWLQQWLAVRTILRHQ
jgi:hypothetical protein